MNSKLLKEIQKYLFVDLKCDDNVLYNSYKGYFGFNKKIKFNMVELKYFNIFNIEYCDVTFFVDSDSAFSVKLILNSKDIDPYCVFDSSMKSNFTMV